MPARGKGFAELRRHLAYVQSEQVKHDVAAVLGASAVKLVADCFLGERDPYGKPWAPLKSRSGKILRKTGRMANSRSASTVGNRTTVAITAWYSILHQKGTKARQVAARKARQNARGQFISASSRKVSRKTFEGTTTRAGYLANLPAHVNPGLPVRAMVPDERGLPKSWDSVFVRDTIAVLRTGGVS